MTNFLFSDVLAIIPDEDAEPIIEFEYIFNDELEEIARDKDIEELQALCEREKVEYH